jgi:hypothetical protein
MRRKTVFGLVLLLIAAAPAYSQTSNPSATPGTAPAATTKQSGPASVAPAAPGRAQAQGTPKPSSPAKSSTAQSSTRNWKTYCSEEAEYCISYPPNWDMVGDVMEGNGVVMAPPQEGKDKSLWDEITVSVTDLPEPEKGREPPSFDDILSVALQGLPGNNVQTSQRTEMTLHGRDAELIRVRYDDKETGKPWVEEIVFIDDELAIYSIALRAVPEDVDGLEDTFRKIVATWRPSEVPPAVPAKPAAPRKPAPSTKAPATKPPGQ